MTTQSQQNAISKFNDFIEKCREFVPEVFPWDLVERMEKNDSILLLDVREPYEFHTMHLKGSLSVPRGILESAVEWGYEETVPELVEARDKEIIIICRAGNRSLLAGRTLQLMGYTHVYSLKTGLRGWNDFEQPLVDNVGNEVILDVADDYFTSQVSEAQLGKSKI
uniref:Rhodanese-related sulfurtransferase n=1 Tax=Candidatus Kentrum sp. TUN TaxID=2126343 RepID=A0A451A191_9GAMM|nr:MAG: Rhodanese-related sulfurtransferase [Candidatus Kentron sp. TUN]VFK63201.1 MAG: Rhodanese-related sulfurtransferase [Candidatus Kentron sp. TUN]VFK68461.1 MAG: Rhodanese-related sulfurtransferase [Candidatus Kentron sp. TUN]